MKNSTLITFCFLVCFLVGSCNFSGKKSDEDLDRPATSPNCNDLDIGSTAILRNTNVLFGLDDGKLVRYDGEGNLTKTYANLVFEGVEFRLNALSENAKEIAVTSDTAVHIVNLDQERIVNHFRQARWFEASRRTLGPQLKTATALSEDGHIEVFDLRRDTLSFSLELPNPPPSQPLPDRREYYQTERAVVVWTQEGFQIVDLATQSVTTTKQALQRYYSGFTSDGGGFVYGSTEGAVVLDLASGKVKRQLDSKGELGVSTDGSVIAIVDDKSSTPPEYSPDHGYDEIRLISLVDYREILKIQGLPGVSGVNQYDLRLGKRRLFAITSNYRGLRETKLNLWDAESGAPLGVWTSSSYAVNQLQVTADEESFLFKIDDRLKYCSFR